MKVCMPHLLASMALLGGCAYRVDDLPKGINTLAGHAVLIMGGYSRGCEEVALVSANDQTSKILSDALKPDHGGFVGEVAFREIEEKVGYQKSARHVGCDEKGNFHFEDIPAGDYYLVARITWLVRLAHRGGFIIRSIPVSGPMTGIEISVLR
jgi:hypothetical protein